MHLIETQPFPPRHNHMILPLQQQPLPFVGVTLVSSLDMVPPQPLSDDGAESNNHAQINARNFRAYHQRLVILRDVVQSQLFQ